MMGMRRGRECTNRDSVDDGDEKRESVDEKRKSVQTGTVDDGEEKRKRVNKTRTAGMRRGRERVCVPTGTVWMMGVRRGRECTNGGQCG